MQYAREDRSPLRSKTKQNRLRQSSVEPLEDRVLLASDVLYDQVDTIQQVDTIWPMATPLSDVEAQPMAGSGSPHGFTPAQLRQAYGFDQIFFDGGTIVGDGTGQTIAIVNAYHTPTAAADLAAFNAAFGLPAPPSFVQIDQNGGVNYPGTHSAWALETALDVQWAHAIAPGANILLVEANSAGFHDLFAAVDTARNYPGVSVVSMSWGAPEWSGESSFNSYLTTPGGHSNVTFFAAAGNSGGPGVYPAYSPNVMAVGGTSLTLNGSNQIIAETAWSGSGGGVSQYQSQPSWQNGVATQSPNMRVMPDVAFNANPNTGVPVYDTFNNSPGTPWTKVAGTSFATPVWASLVAIANQGRTLAGLQALDTTALMTRIYSMPASNFNDITTGSSTGSLPQAAGVGFDAVTGRGTPKAALVVNSLVGVSAAPSGLALQAASDTGISSSDGITRFNNSSLATRLTFQVSGTVPGATVHLYADGVLIGSAVAAGTTTNVTTSGNVTLSDGLRNITARQVVAGNPESLDSPGLGITIDTVAPTASFVPVSPDPRTSPVGSVGLNFSEAVYNLNHSALQLTRNSGGNLLSGSQTITTTDNVQWTLGNLSAITTTAGVYDLLLQSGLGGVTDIAGNLAANAAESFTKHSQIAQRRLFYNQSSFDGSSAAINAADDGAIATDKTAYLAGSGLAPFASVSSYTRGINGLMIDLSGGTTGITAADFVFRVGNNNNPGSWTAAPAPTAISVRQGAGLGGSDRVVLTWATGAISNQWLEVTVKPTATTGLALADVFYFGSKVADSGTGLSATHFETTPSDSLQIFSFAGSNKPITDLRDYNRDGSVLPNDSLVVFANAGSIVRLNLPQGDPLVEPLVQEAEPPSRMLLLTTAASAPPAEPLAATPLIAELPAVAPTAPAPIDRSLAFALAANWISPDTETIGEEADLDASLLELLAAGRLKPSALRR